MNDNFISLSVVRTAGAHSCVTWMTSIFTNKKIQTGRPDSHGGSLIIWSVVDRLLIWIAFLLTPNDNKDNVHINIIILVCTIPISLKKNGLILLRMSMSHVIRY